MASRQKSAIAFFAALTILAVLPGMGFAVQFRPLSAPRVLYEMPVTAQDERLAIANNSPLLVADPRNEKVVVLVSRTDNPDFGCRLHVSGDGGRSWLPSEPVPQLPPGVDKCYSPEAAFDKDGRLLFLFIGLAGPGNSPVGTYLVTSTEGGYSRPRRILGPERYMVRMAVEPAGGRIHLVWLEARSDPPLGGLGPPPNPIMSAYSDNGGRRFSRPAQVSEPARLAVAPALALGPEGAVHVLYYDLMEDLRDYHGLEGPRWEGDWSLISASSSNAGRSFRKGVVVNDEIAPPERVMLVYTMPPPALVVDPGGRLFASWHDARNGDWDVFVSRAGDRGRSWTPPQRLNDDPRRNGRHQYLPRLSVSKEGRLDAVFYDRRRDPNNISSDLFYTYSTNGGRGFAPNKRVTRDPSHSQIGPRYPIPSAINLVETGSRIALLSRPSGALTAWTDTRNSQEATYQQDIFATTISLAGKRSSPDRGWGRLALPIGGAATLLALAGGALVRARGRRPG